MELASDRKKEKQFKEQDFGLKRDTKNISGVHKVKNEIAKTIPQFEELWQKWNDPIFVSVMAEKRRIWRKDKSFTIGIDEKKSKEIMWLFIKETTSKIFPKVSSKELSEHTYIISKLDGNVHRIEWNPDSGNYKLEYFLTDILYCDHYYIEINNGQYKLITKKWMKFPIPINALSLVADVGKKQLKIQWKNFVNSVQKGINSTK